MLSGLIIAIVASSKELGSIITYEHIVSDALLCHHLPIHLLLSGRIALESGYGRRHELELFSNTPHTKLEDGTQGKIGVHVSAGHANFKPCRRWRNRWRRDYADGSCTRIVPICNSIRSPEGFTAYETFVTINRRYKLPRFVKMGSRSVRVWVLTIGITASRLALIYAS